MDQKGLLAILDEEYRSKGGFKGGSVYSTHIAKIIQNRCKDEKLVEKVEEITAIEGTVRNAAAHEMVSVTDEWFRERTGKTANGIFSVIKYLLERAGVSIKQEDWESYDKMNEKIIKTLR